MDSKVEDGTEKTIERPGKSEKVIVRTWMNEETEAYCSDMHKT